MCRLSEVSHELCGWIVRLVADRVAELKVELVDSPNPVGVEGKCSMISPCVGSGLQRGEIEND